MIIGITGGIGSGKSTLSNRFRKAGYAVYDTDSAARRLQNESAEIRQQTIALFGAEAYTDNVLNRKYIAGIVFNQPEILHKLNEIVHPAVRADFKVWAQNHSSEEILFLECAVLFQGDFQKLVDKIILVTAPQTIRIQRVIKRDGLSEQQVIERINNQLTDTEMAAKSDLIIDTGETDISLLDVNSILQNLH